MKSFNTGDKKSTLRASRSPFESCFLFVRLVLILSLDLIHFLFKLTAFLTISESEGTKENWYDREMAEIQIRVWRQDPSVGYSFEVHPSSYPVRTRSYTPGVKVNGVWSSPSNSEVWNALSFGPGPPVRRWSTREYVTRLVLLFIKGKGKGKAVPVLLFLTQHHAMKAYWGVEV